MRRIGIWSSFLFYKFFFSFFFFNQFSIHYSLNFSFSLFLYLFVSLTFSPISSFTHSLSPTLFHLLNFISDHLAILLRVPILALEKVNFRSNSSLDCTISFFFSLQFFSLLVSTYSYPNTQYLPAVRKIHSINAKAATSFSTTVISLKI